jgi:hypothetical protein
MRKGWTSLNRSEAIWWQAFRREAEIEAWNRLVKLFPRLEKFQGPAGDKNGFRYQKEKPIGPR